MPKAKPEEHLCKHSNDDELCEEICAEKNCGHKCCYHGTGSCGLCNTCDEFVNKKKKKAKSK